MRTKLNEQEAAWLEEHAEEIDRDCAEPTEWPMSWLSPQQLEQRRSNCTWAEYIEGRSNDMRALNKLNLTRLEREILRLRFIERLPVREIAGMTCKDIYIDGILVDRVSMRHTTILGIIEKAKRKVPWSGMTTSFINIE